MVAKSAAFTAIVPINSGAQSSAEMSLGGMAARV